MRRSATQSALRFSRNCQALRTCELLLPMDTLRLHSVSDRVTTLGPGPAAGLWVQGCTIGCSRCTSPESWSTTGGVLARVDDIARWLGGLDVCHLTVSGGEPLEQAPALGALLDAIRRVKDWFVTCYSGYSLEALERDHRPGTAALLERLDLLIDGPYVERLHAPLLWRGSSNQRIHDLSGRVRLPADDRSAGFAPVFFDDGSFEFIGVFPEAGMFDRISEALASRGTPVSIAHRARPFPFPTHQEP